MSQIRFDQINTNETITNNNIGFFSLRNDGDEAIVRIMHDSIDSFDLVTTHPIQIGGKYRRVNCIRDPHEALDNCPLCRSGSKIQQRMYIHLIQYVRDDQGKITPQGKVWERAASYAVTIKNLIDEYGPLSNCIFKIRRNGKAGSMDTTYSILYSNPQVYRNEDYPKINNMFESYSAVGTAVLNKNFDEISEFIATGDFPQAAKVARQNPESDIPSTYNDNNVRNIASQQNNTFVRDNMVNPTTANPLGPQQYIDPNTHMVNNESVTAPIQRPVRYY